MWLFVLFLVVVWILFQIRLCVDLSFDSNLSVKGRIVFVAFPIYPRAEKKQKSTTVKKKKAAKIRLSKCIKKAFSIQNLLEKKPSSLSLKIQKFHLIAGAHKSSDTALLHSGICALLLAFFSVFDCMFSHFSVKNVFVTPSFEHPCLNVEAKARFSLSIWDFIRLVYFEYRKQLKKENAS